MKNHKSKVSVPGYVKDMAMMDAVNNKGRVDRVYIRTMCKVINDYDKKRNDNMKKMNRSLSSDD